VHTYWVHRAAEKREKRAARAEKSRRFIEA
jgi:hypothetical protein